MSEIVLPQALQNLTRYPDDYVKNAERDGALWAALPDGALTGIVGTNGNQVVQESCATEMQRRVVHAIRDFNATASEQTRRLIASADEASTQTRKIIGLTWAIALLTVAILILTFVLALKG